RAPAPRSPASASLGVSASTPPPRARLLRQGARQRLHLRRQGVPALVQPGERLLLLGVRAPALFDLLRPHPGAAGELRLELLDVHLEPDDLVLELLELAPHPRHRVLADALLGGRRSAAVAVRAGRAGAALHRHLLLVLAPALGLEHLDLAPQR